MSFTRSTFSHENESIVPSMSAFEAKGMKKENKTLLNSSAIDELGSWCL